MLTPRYAELGAATNFSFLEGASHPHEMLGMAKALGLAAIGIADRNTLAGMVRAHVAAEEKWETGEDGVKRRVEPAIKLLVGCRLVFTDGTELIVFARDRAAYGRLCRLLSQGKSAVLGDEGKQHEVAESVEEAAATNVIAFPLSHRSRESGNSIPPVLERAEGSGLDPRFRGDDRSGNDAGGGEGEEGEGCGKGSEAEDGSEDPRADAAYDNAIPKAETRLTFAQAAALGEGLIALVPAPAVPDDAFAARLAEWRAAWPDALYTAAAPLWRGDDRARLAKLARIARAAGAPLVATNLARFHDPGRRRVQDVLTCVRLGTTIDKAGLALEAHAERHLKPAAEMARLFRGHEDAIARTAEIADACTFSLTELSYHYPDEPVPRGWTAFQHLVRLTWEGARKRWPQGLPPGIEAVIAKELGLIRTLDYAAYFLTVHDIVAWARHPDRRILCQGRGSAANSVVCYCLFITAIDPTHQDVLIERFISAQRSEPPDIDVDFEHERREEVMQYIYRRYGRHRAAIVATVIHYRPRSAIRDVGKALGLTEDVTARLADTVWGSFGKEIRETDVDRTGVHREDPRLALALEITATLIGADGPPGTPGFPRHLSQHVGGYVLTQGPLVETVPIGNGAMKDRTFIEWDKDDIDALRMMKVDVLALGMLTALRRGFDMLAAEYGMRSPDGGRMELSQIMHTEKPRVYAMCQRADTLGVFQIESRAQMAMLPRLLPKEYYDLVVEVAIVRPGPIQGKMVHPYLANRAKQRAAEARNETFEIDFPAPTHGDPNELKAILDKTLGVPLFQEQAMRIAMVAAEFTGDEANELRKAMATFRHVGTIGKLERRMVDKMIERGYPPEFAENCFGQIKGFGEYGFPESHAASFAHLVYISAWLKCDHPDVFAAALLNSQPMGFYAPAQIVRDAREHGIEVRPVDVNASHWDCTLERRGRRRRRALRLGLRQLSGFRQAWAEAIVAARANAPFDTLDDLRRRVPLPSGVLDRLAAADALGSLDLRRRPGLWAAAGMEKRAPAPLFEAAGIDEGDGAPPDALPPLGDVGEVIDDYRTLRLSLKGHPAAWLRGEIARVGGCTAAELKQVREGRRTAVAGVVLVRQRPGSAKGVVFLTVEDETGVANAVVWPSVFEEYRPQAMGARMLLIRGKVQRADGVTHLVAERLEDWSARLDALGEDAPRASPAPEGWLSADPRETGRRRHPRDVRVIPASRDFH